MDEGEALEEQQEAGLSIKIEEYNELNDGEATEECVENIEDENELDHKGIGINVIFILFIL